jgi:hypothetical protein
LTRGADAATITSAQSGVVLAMPFQVHIDPERNRVSMTLVGLLSDAEVGAVIAEVLRGIRTQLKPGFIMVSDLREMRPFSQESVRLVREGTTVMRSLGMAHAVRMLGRSAVAAMQVKRETMAAGYEAHLVHSPEEAEALFVQLSAESAGAGR